MHNRNDVEKKMKRISGAAPVTFKCKRKTRTTKEEWEYRPVGGESTAWGTIIQTQEGQEVSYDEMCRTIDLKLARHEAAAKEQLKALSTITRLREETPLQKKAKVHTENDRLESNKSDKSGVCSMGALVGHKSLDTEHETHKKPITERSS